MQVLFWQKVPSGQGTPFLAHGAFKPLHSLAVQDDISVETDMGPMNPSEQNPLEHFWPIGQWLFARQGSLADPPLDFLYTFGPLERFNTTSKTSVSVRNIPKRVERLISSN